MLNLDFLPYSFKQTQDDFYPYLSFIGTTYYEGFNVFEHLKKPPTLLGFHTGKVELYFSGQHLIGISIFINESFDYIEDIKTCLISCLGQAETLVNNIELESIEDEICAWEDELYVIGLLLTSVNKEVFIHVIKQTSRVLW